MSETRIPKRLRDQVRDRANGYCEYCRCPDIAGTAPYAVEHVIPESKGGATVPENLAWACPYCNGSKYTRVDGWDPATSKWARLFNPRKQRWSSHFVWSDDMTRVLGTTSTGRATVETLQLNRPPIMVFRGMLVNAGYLPPPE
ncbi:HNH endonuclease [Aquisphaera insulae]|uniref:HNH endonuclease n=1 Tax=Aquisphaera insulae TaxID=2712864 RepID=UPI0013EB56DF